MSTMTAESIFPLIAQLPPPERAKLRDMLDQPEAPQQATEPPPAKAPRDKRLPNRPMPSGGEEATRWIAEHRREYAGQWVALDGARLIAASPNCDEVFAAAEADGAVLPLTTFVEDPDNIVHIIWT